MFVCLFALGFVSCIVFYCCFLLLFLHRRTTGFKYIYNVIEKQYCIKMFYFCIILINCLSFFPFFRHLINELWLHWRFHDNRRMNISADVSKFKILPCVENAFCVIYVIDTYFESILIIFKIEFIDSCERMWSEHII
jgi:hypothetical protein